MMTDTGFARLVYYPNRHVWVLRELAALKELA